MSLDKVFDIAGSGMSAQSLRLNTVASNIANAETVSSSVDETYRARNPVFATIFNSQQATGGSLFSPDQQAGDGVSVLGIVESDATLEPRYEPEPLSFVDHAADYGHSNITYGTPPLSLDQDPVPRSVPPAKDIRFF